MPYQLSPFTSIPLDAALLEWLIDDHESRRLPCFARLWNYYRNALADPNDTGGSRGAPSQWVGLPARLTEPGRSAHDARYPRELVIENDIAWRIQTLVDFMFPAPPVIRSTARNSAKRAEIEGALQAVFDASGGNGLWQQAALLGSIYGHVDFLLRMKSPRDHSGSAPSRTHAIDSASRAATHVAIETVEAPRAIALLDRNDYRLIDAYILHYHQAEHAVKQPGTFQRLRRRMLARDAGRSERATIEVTEVHTSRAIQRYEDGALVSQRTNRLERIPIVHVQNLAQPLMFEGLSDVEPLIPLQDELNTRLSDRANRVTMQSFRMWLGKGVEGFHDRPVGPGQMWVTDNTDASIESFGGDADSPSERAHIEELREAMDKASGVTPAAAGHIKAKVGNLTSENALRISLMGTIAKVKRKRVTYGEGIKALSELILHALDRREILPTTSEERGVQIVWPDPLPVDESRRIDDALSKAQLGVPLAQLRAELGYGEG